MSAQRVEGRPPGRAIKAPACPSLRAPSGQFENGIQVSSSSRCLRPPWNQLESSVLSLRCQLLTYDRTLSRPQHSDHPFCSAIHPAAALFISRQPKEYEPRCPVLRIDGRSSLESATGLGASELEREDARSPCRLTEPDQPSGTQISLDLRPPPSQPIQTLLLNSRTSHRTSISNDSPSHHHIEISIHCEQQCRPHRSHRPQCRTQTLRAAASIP